jgi:uncharacterized protein YigE (DUF2233 family)
MAPVGSSITNGANGGAVNTVGGVGNITVSYWS